MLSKNQAVNSNAYLLRPRNCIKSLTSPSACKNAFDVATLISSLPTKAIDAATAIATHELT